MYWYIRKLSNIQITKYVSSSVENNIDIRRFVGQIKRRFHWVVWRNYGASKFCTALSSFRAKKAALVEKRQFQNFQKIKMCLFLANSVSTGNEYF